MRNNIFDIVATVGLACSIIAGLMAFVITYNEYSHHFAEKKDAVKESIEAGVVTFVFFNLLTAAIAFLISYLI